MNVNNLYDEKGFQEVLKVLEEDLTANEDWEELNPEDDWLNPDINYLKSVAQGLIYKVSFLYNIIKNSLISSIDSLVLLEHPGR